MSKANIKILVTAAAGSIGSQAVRELLRQEVSVRALVRVADSRSEALKDAGAEIFIGDLSNFQSVSSAMDGVTGVLFIYPIAPGLIESAQYVAQAAKEAGVQMIVNISQHTAVRNAPSHSAQSSWLAERLLDHCGVPVTHLQPTLFMDWLLYFASAIRDHQIYLTPFGDTKVALIDTGDIARVAVSLFENVDEHAGKTYPLYGPAELNGEEAAGILSAVLGKQVRFAQLTPEAFGDILAQQHFPPYNIQHLVAVGHMFRSGEFVGSGSLVKALSGQEPATVEEFVRCHLPAYQTSQQPFTVNN